MSKRYSFAIEQRDAHITSLRLVCGLLAVVALVAFFGWRSAPKQMTVHIPPDLRSGSVQSVYEVPPSNVYAFASYVFQVLNHWETDGDSDYGDNIYQYQAFLTPDYQSFLIKDFKERSSRGETRNRRRVLLPIPGRGFSPKNVVAESDSSWIVALNFETVEHQGGVEVKRTKITWPIRVVRYDVNRAANPWGLALDGIPSNYAPEIIDETKLAEVAQ